MVLGTHSPDALTLGAPRSAGAFPLAQEDFTDTGIWVPPGSLDRWFAARNAAVYQLAEAVEFGDSTWYGETLSGPYYSPLQRVRELLVADGYADGGHGNQNGADDVTSSGDSLVVGQGFDSQNVYVLPGESKFSEADGDHQTFTRVGRYLTIYYTRFNDGGRFTYEIDNSGTEIAVDPAPPHVGGVYTFDKLTVDLGSDGSHTIKIRNKGGRLLLAPDYTSSSGTGSGSGDSIPVGTYEYAAAFVATDGKVGPLGATRTITITGTQGYSMTIPAQQYGGPTTRLYRRVAGSGAAFKQVGSASTDHGSPYAIPDTAGATPGADYAQGAAPILESTKKWVNVSTVVTKATGIVLHNFAARGSGSGMAANAYNLALALGLDLEPIAATAAVDRAIDTNPGARNPVLVLFTHGINDQQTTTPAATMKANTITGIRAARYAGADALVCIPAFESALHSENAPDYRTALKEAAEEELAPWVDLGMGGALPDVTAGSTSNNPHLTTAQYQAQGDFLYQVLGAT